MTRGKTRLLATVTDFKSLTVAITQAAWNHHVLRNHPTMVFRLEDVKTTLQSPDLVKEDFVLGCRNWLYYKEFKTDKGKHYLKVAVRWDRRLGTHGFLTTAYPLGRTQGGIKIIWPEP